MPVDWLDRKKWTISALENQEALRKPNMTKKPKDPFPPGRILWKLQPPSLKETQRVPRRPRLYLGGAGHLVFSLFSPVWAREIHTSPSEQRNAYRFSWPQTGGHQGPKQNSSCQMGVFFG